MANNPGDHQCTARSKRSGKQCKRAAVPGAVVCTTHGGRAPQVMAKAAERLAEQQAVRIAASFAVRRDIHPADALLELVQWTAGEVDYWREQVRLVEQDDPAALTFGVTKVEKGLDRGDRTNIKTREAAPHIAYRMLTDASDRLAKYAGAALKAGVDERRVRLAEQQGLLVALVIRRVLDRLDLTEAQLQLVPVIVPEELRALSAPSSEQQGA